MSEPARPFATKTEWVYDRLRQRILAGDYGPDDRLRLTALARGLGTSELPVREALRMLQRDGLIVMHSHRGAAVANVSSAKAAEIVAVRMHLEVLAAAEAAPYHDVASLAGLRRLSAEMDAAGEAGDAGRFSEANRAFHRAVYAPGRNETLKQEIEDLWDRVWRTRSRSIFALLPTRMAGAQAEHRAILDALARGRVEEVQRAMAAHRAATLAGWRKGSPADP